MSEDDYWRPERATELSLARKNPEWKRALQRYHAHVEKFGKCSVCKHRSKVEGPFGMPVCVVGDIRRHPACEKDGKGLEYVLDESALEQFKDKAA